MASPRKPAFAEPGARRRATWSSGRGKTTLRPVPPAANDNRQRWRTAIAGLMAFAVAAVLAVAAALILGG